MAECDLCGLSREALYPIVIDVIKNPTVFQPSWEERPEYRHLCKTCITRVKAIKIGKKDTRS